MTIIGPEMRSNNFASMDIDQLRGWAAFMDRAMIVSLAAVIAAVMALGATTWLSFKFGSAVRAHEHSMLDKYKAMESHSAQGDQDVVTARDRVVALEKEVSEARERAAALEQEVSKRQGGAAALEQEVSAAQGRTVALEQELSAMRERTAALEQEASTARERSAAFERAAREANERAARAPRESAAASEKSQAPQIDAAEIQQRLADLGKLVRAAAAQTADPLPASTAETPRPVSAPGLSETPAASREGPPESPVVAKLRKYAGTKAAVFVVQPVSDAQAAGSAISAYLSDAGWAPETWTWTGVGGIFGVVVLIKEGSDPATNEAASAFVEALGPAGFNVTKGDWPANWSRFRGMLDGPQTPGPTEAPIRIVIGAKPR
jgi:predicted  nucleic acid-binding Zn-ribbon protein